MRPMTLQETGHSTGDISIRKILDGEDVSAGDPKLSVETLSELVARGGWPGNLDLPLEECLMSVRGYLEEVRRVDISRVESTRRDPVRVGRLLRSLARNVATEVAISTLAADAGGSDGPLTRDTVRDYLTALERLMIVEDQPAWSPHLRSKSVLRKSAKRHFVDPSLAVAALGATPERLLEDLELFGFLFESLVVRDLRVFADANDARVFHYRDNTGLEVDAILETADGQWCAFEIKLASGRVDEAAESLKTFSERVNQDRTGEPRLLGVIVGRGFGYMRDDGIAVIPIGVLGP